MAQLSLVATVGASTSNSYVLVAEADSYFATRYNGRAWFEQHDEVRRAMALITGTYRLDQLSYRGQPVNPITGTTTGATQALKFPRAGVRNTEGDTYLETIIPEPIKLSTFELALEILTSDEDFLADTGLADFSELGVGQGAVTMKIRGATESGTIPDRIMRWLQHMLDSSSDPTNFDVWRG